MKSTFVKVVRLFGSFVFGLANVPKVMVFGMAAPTVVVQAPKLRLSVAANDDVSDIDAATKRVIELSFI